MQKLTLASLQIFMDKADPRLVIPRVILTYSASSQLDAMGRQLERDKLVSVGGNHFIGFQDARNGYGVMLRYLNLGAVSHSHFRKEICTAAAAQYEVLLQVENELEESSHSQPLAVTFDAKRD